MPDVPRYLATSAAGAAAALRGAFGDELFLRAFDLDGDNDVAADSEDERVLVAAVCFAEREIDEYLAASHGAPFTGTVPPSIRDITLLMAAWCAVQFRSKIAGDEKARAPFKGPYDRALKRLERLAADKQARIPETGAPAPTSALPMVISEPLVWGCGSGSGSNGF